MFKRHHAAAFLFTCAGLTASVEFSAIGQTTAPAAALLDQGLEAYRAGNLEAAKDLLIQIDPMTLPKEQRQQLYDAATQIQTALDAAPTTAPAATPAVETPAAVAEPVRAPAPSIAEPTPAERLRRADALAATDPGTAIAVYTGLIEQGGSEGATASARRADLLRQLGGDTTRAKALIDTAETDLAAGRIDDAAGTLAAVQQSNADLGWFDQQRVTRGLARVESERSAAAAVAPQNASAVQPQSAAVAPSSPAPAAASPPPSGDVLAKARRDVAREYLRDAKQAQSEGYNDLAVNLLSQASELDPDNPEIRNSLADARGSGGRANALGQAVNDIELRRQQAIAGYQEALTNANARLTAGDYAGAATEAARARQVMELNQELFARDQFESLRQDAIKLSARIDEQGKAAALANEKRIEADTAEADAQATSQAQARNRQEVRDLIVRARQLQIEMKYDEAILLLEQALFTDPTNFTAELLKEVIEDAKLTTDYRDALRTRRLSVAQLQIENLNATVPYKEILTYPTNWPEISEERIRNLDVSGGESQANREAANKLRKAVPIDFDANSLESVLDYIRQTTEANIFVNWSALESAGVERDMPVSLKLSNVSAQKALQLILQQVTSAAGDLDIINYSIIDGVITVSTENDLFRSKDLRVFDIRDLLVQVPNFSNAPSFDLSEALSNTSSGGGGSGGGGDSSIFGDSNDDDDDSVVELSRSELIQQITDLIQESVGTVDEWDNFDSTIRELNGNLIVRTTPDNHRQILGLLAKLRETRAIQISVETRFLLVDRNFLDRVGVDVAFGFEGSSGSSQSGTPFDSSDDLLPDQGLSPVVVNQNSLSLAEPSSGDLGFLQFFQPAGSGLQALNLGAAFIDDISVNLLVEATLANQNSISLTAPRVTFFNGQRAYVTVASQLSFISEVEAVPDTGGFNLTLSVVVTGVVLDVEGTISADRRYVTMTLRPSLANLADLRTIPQTSVTQLTDTDGNAVGLPFVSTVNIEAPELEITTVNTTVSVPDRGTLLVGGQRLVGEAEIEVGVPVLSKIPILNRLFTNTTTTEDERTLLILVKPTIIIQSEQEEELFPGLGDKLLEAGQGVR